MRVAIVHDDMVQWGGAERVLEGLCEIYPQAPIFTSIFDYSNNQLVKRFADKKIITSFLQKIPGRKIMYKALLPLYPIAFEQFNFDDYDLVISHTTRFAKSIITKPKTKHICYCHTPSRFLWRFSGEISYGILETLMSKLRIYDQISAKRVDYFLAGSENAKKRIKKVYHQDAKVVYPFIDLDRFKDVETFDGGYFLVISRLNKYKRVDLAVEACLELGLPLKIIGEGSEIDKLKKLVDDKGNWGNKIDRGLIEFLGKVDDETVVQILSGCQALIIPGIEDFGLTSLEAQAVGKPVIAFKSGGVLETVIDGKTGLFFDEPTIASLTEVLQNSNDLNLSSERKSRDQWNNAKLRKQHARGFSKQNFIKNFKQTVASLVY